MHCQRFLLEQTSLPTMKRAANGGGDNGGNDGGNDGGSNGGNDGRKRMRVAPEHELNPWIVVLLALWMSSTLTGPNWNFEEVCRTWLEIMQNFRS